MTKTSATKDTSRESVFDVDVEKLAGIYAQAALDAAGDQEDEVLSDLQTIVSEALDAFPDIEEVFGSALVSIDEKTEMLDRLFGSRVSDSTLSFLKVLTKHDRLGVLRQVVRVAEQLWERRSNRVPVQLETAVELGDALEAEVVESLKNKLGIDPVITKKINPDLIAGFVVRVGDKVYDASTKASLERSRQSMIMHAVEAIQADPDQFMSTTETE